ncbi:MAG: SMC-Scp complex subunit ScpB [Chloroflexi bacterium]|nr:SMC-Scp complex subunit ScpB [Chloroflexota bacterium]
MDRQTAQNTIESLLFMADKPVELKQMERVLDIAAEAVEDALAGLEERCRQGGVRLLRVAGTVQMVTAPEAAPYVERFLGLGGGNKLSQAALETLAIISYRQPVTRAGIEAIRGVNSDQAVATLLARGLIQEVGRMETVGRPVLFGTTFEFLQYFGLQGLQELPGLDVDHTEG